MNFIKFIKWKRTSGNVFLGHLGGWEFFTFFPKSWEGECFPQIPFRIFVDVTMFNSSPMQHLRWSSLWQKLGSKVFHLPLTCSKVIKKKTKKRATVNNKDTRTTSGASVVTFEHIPLFILQLLLLYCWIRINKCWLSLRNGSHTENCFQ